ncbi:MAG: hypothetical protein JWL69_1862 [Phycisphaerales bacterium]|nr:hypothetical protein [Phycisphaerales bacterium]
MEYGPPAPGLLFGAADNDTVTPDPDVPAVDPGLIESPQHGQVTINTADGSFDYQPAAGFVGRDWFTYRLLDGSKPSDYATIFIDVLPLNISLSVGDLAPGDPAALIPTFTNGLPTGPYVQLHLNDVNGLPQGSTVTLSMNSDVVPDLNVSSLQPGAAGNVQFIGHDAGANTYTWTVGVNSPPPYVWAVGLTGTDYDQVLFHLTVLVAPTITGTPTVAAAATSQPMVAAQNATVLGKGGYLVALDGTADAEPDNTNIYQFYKLHYAGTNAQYNRGPGNSVDHPNVASRDFLIAFGDAEAVAIERGALAKLNNFYQDPAQAGVVLDTIGYSRGAFEAVALVNDMLRKGIPVQSTKYTTRGMFGVPIATGYKAYVATPKVRFVGLISPVMGPARVPFLWDFSVPSGTHWMYQGLDKDLAGLNPILPQFPIGRPAGTAGHDIVYKKLGHQEVGHDPGVLKDMLADAKNAGVPVK